MHNPVLFIPKHELVIPRFESAETIIELILSDNSRLKEIEFNPSFGSFLANKYGVGASWDPHPDENGAVFHYVDQSGNAIPTGTLDATGGMVTKLDTDGIHVRADENYIMTYGIQIRNSVDAFVRWGFATQALQNIDIQTTHFNDFCPNGVFYEQ